jgi:hypothetical protein
VHETNPKIVVCDFFLFSIIYCTSDSAPDLEYIKKNKQKPTLIIWDRTEKKENTIPNGWYSFALVGTRPDLGILYVQEEYKKKWSESVKRALRRWQSQERYIITEISLDTYLAAYTNSTVIAYIKQTYSKLLPVYSQNYLSDFVCYGVIDTTTGQCIAGLSTVYEKETDQSKHVSAFLLNEAYKTDAGTALMNHWVQETNSQKLSYANFGIVWKKGDPNSWKGYSAFKLHFGLTRVIHQTPLTKILW